MEINSAEIGQLYGKGLKGDYEGILHRKSLPCLSVVQVVSGSYEVSLNGGKPFVVKEGCAFVAPAGVAQEILHRNGEEGYMEAHWAFMNITLNGCCAFEDAFSPPSLIPREYAEEVYKRIDEIRNGATLCARYAAAYRLIDLLILLSKPKKEQSDPTALRIKRFVEAHFAEPLTQEMLAEVAAVSVSSLYRLFSKRFGMSPRNYINKIRLEKGAILLETSDLSVSEVACAVGFEDAVYFSKLFKENFGLSPQNYRKR